MTWKETQDAITRAFNTRFTDFAANREAAICTYNAMVEGQLIQRAMPKRYESWLDENNVKMVAMPSDQVEELIKIRDEFSELMDKQNKNIHGQSRSELRRIATLKGEEMPTFDE